MFGDIPQNVWGRSLECLVTFPGVFEDIAQNVWRQSPECNIAPISHIPYTLFPVHVFLVLYIAKFGVLCFLVSYVLRFVLLPYYR